jgi:hypothetical protein
MGPCPTPKTLGSGGHPVALECEGDLLALECEGDLRACVLVKL